MSWKKVKLGEFLKVRENRYKPNDKSIARLKRIDKIDFSGNIFLSDKFSKTDMILVKKGDLVISGINVEKGAMSVYQGEEDVTATIHYSSYEFDTNKIDIDFLKFYLKSDEFREAIKEQVPGGIKTEIKPKHLLPLVIEIPTKLNEQKQIVKQLQNNFEKIDNLNNEQSHQLFLLKNLRQQILKDAMQGKLVESKSAESGKTLLEKIKVEKAKLNKKEKPLAEIKADEIPFDIPKNWVWCRLGEIAIYSEAGKSYIASDVSANEKEWAVIKTSAITSGIFLEDENKKLPNQKLDYEKIKINVGDILFCRASGSKGLAGKSCVIETEPKSKLILSDKSIRFVFSEYVSKKFVQFYNSSSLSFDYYNGLGTGKSTSMNNITREQFNNLPIPLPPLSEQQRIVSKIEELMTLCDALEASVKQNQEYTNLLYQTALKEALQNP